MAAERKSLDDLFGTLTRGRDGSKRGLERLAEFDFYAVVVDGTWFDIGEKPAFASRVNPAFIVWSILALKQRYTNTHWPTFGGRRTGQWLMYGILRRFWIDQVETLAKEQRQRIKAATKEMTASRPQTESKRVERHQARRATDHGREAMVQPLGEDPPQADKQDQGPRRSTHGAATELGK